MDRIEEIRESYAGEWLAIAILEESKGKPAEVELVCHSGDKDEVWKEIRGDSRRIYVTYAGPMLREGYAAAF